MAQQQPKLIYLWSDDYFCAGCIVRAMLEHEPWIEWAETYDNAEFMSTPLALSAMARHFNLRSTLQRRGAGFPQIVNDSEDTIFCAVCLDLLHTNI